MVERQRHWLSLGAVALASAFVGLLFGLTDDTSDLTLKCDAEIEF